MSALFVNDFLTCGTIVSNQRGKLLIGWGNRQNQEHIHPNEEVCFYFPDYFLSINQPWSTHQSTRELAIEELIFALEQSEFSPPPSKNLDWKNIGERFFSDSFNDLQQKFASGTLSKAVPFIFESTAHQMNPTNLCHSLLSALRYAKNNSVYLYGFWGQGEEGKGGMLGATPEYLFQRNSTTVKVLACGGTCPRAEAIDLAQDPKQRHEHDLIVKGIMESLSFFGKTTQGDLDLLILPTLCHLVTPIAVELNRSADFCALVHALHPTPAVGAFPKKEGMEWLKNYQTTIDRSRFGAPAGYVWRKKQEAACYVAIRNAQWSKEYIKIGAGCGIVSQSQLDLEWKEIQLKIQSIKDFLALN